MIDLKRSLSKNFTIYKPRSGTNNSDMLGFLEFWSFVIILNTLVPISLYVRYDDGHALCSSWK